MKLLILLLLKIAQAFQFQASDPVYGQMPEIQKIFREAEALLPAKMKKMLPDELPVRFAVIDATPKGEINCPGSTLGTYSRNQITVHQNLLEGVLGSNVRFSQQCYYQNAKTAMIANLIHEATHALDIAYYPEAHGCHKNLRTPDCLYLLSSKGWISRDIGFIFLQGYRNQGEIISKVNSLPLASPLPHEFLDLKESVATHMELFLLDKNYACKRPALARYLLKKFEMPETRTCTDAWPGVFENTSVASLDLNKLYQIHIVYADPGETVISNWGHIMIRLAFCAPFRTSPSAECLKDIMYHQIISPRGNIDSLNMSLLKFFGGYETQFHLIPMIKVLKMYTIDELRSLHSYPLKLSESEKADLFFALLEKHWLYRSDFRAISNNCAVETLSVLIGALPDLHDLAFIGRSFLTPNYTVQTLLKRNRLDRIDNKPGLYFPSLKPSLLEAYRRLGLKEGANFEQITAKANLSLPSAILIVDHSLGNRRRSLDEKINQDIVESKIPEVVELRNRVNRAIAEHFLRQKTIAQAFYGAPSLQGMQQFAMDTKNDGSFQKDREQMKEWMAQIYAAEINEIEKWSQLRDQLTRKL